MEIVQVQAKEIKHPILKPLTLDMRDGLSPNGAAVLAVLVNPRLAALRDQKGIAAAQLLQAGILPNPQFAYSLDVPTGGNTLGTVNAYGFTFDWDIRTLITRRAQLDVGRAQSAAVDLGVAWQEWQVAQAARLHVYRLVLLEQERAVANEEEKGLQENVTAVGRAVDLHDMTITSLSAAEAAVQRAHVSVVTIDQQHEQERLALNQSLGFPPETVIPLQSNIKMDWPQALPTAKEIMAGIEVRRLDLLALKMGYQSQEARLRAAVRAQFPRINIGFSRLRDTGDVVTRGFVLSISLPIFDRNQGLIAIERASRKQLFDEYADRVFETRAQISRILADVEFIRRLIEANEKSILTLRNLLKTSYRGFLEGNVDVLSYYNARSELIAKEVEALRLKQTLTDLNIALEIEAGEYTSPMENKEVPN